MALGSTLGFLIGALFFILPVAMHTDNYWSFMNLPEFLMVFGGTICGAFMNYEARYVRLALKAMVDMYKKAEADRESILTEIMHLIKWGYVVQAKGLVALEPEVNAATIKHPILKYGAELVSSGYKPQEVREMLEIAVETTYERNMVATDILKNMASAAPAFGMIGTLLGLILMFQSLGEDFSALGAGMAVALLATLYGVATARFVFMPAGLKNGQKQEILRHRNLIVAEGLVLLAEKQNPRYMQDRLNGFLDPDIHFNIDKQLR